jgi:hypothetical protein
MIIIKCIIGDHVPNSLNIRVANHGVVEAIEIDPSSRLAFYYRGFTKLNLNNKIQKHLGL